MAAEQAGPTHVSVDVGSEHRGPIGWLFSTARRTPDSGNEKEFYGGPAEDASWPHPLSEFSDLQSLDEEAKLPYCLAFSPHIFICSVCVCARAHVNSDMPWHMCRDQSSSCRSLLWHPMGPGEPAQVVRLGNKSPHPLTILLSLQLALYRQHRGLGIMAKGWDIFLYTQGPGSSPALTEAKKTIVVAPPLPPWPWETHPCLCVTMHVELENPMETVAKK